MTQRYFSHTKKIPIVVGLVSISILLWIIFASVYFMVRDEYAIRNFQRSAFTFAESSQSAVLAPTSAPTSIPIAPQAPTAVPTVMVPTNVIVPQPTQTIGSGTVPTPTPLPFVQPSGSSRTPITIPTLVKASGKLTPTHTSRSSPTPTPRLPYSHIHIVLRFPDVDPFVSRIQTAQIVFYRQDSNGAWVRLPETKSFTNMRRIGKGDYFENEDDVEIKIRVGPLNKNALKNISHARYGMYIKGISTIGRFFTGIVLKETKIKGVSPLIQCGITASSVKECGDLVALRDEKPLFSGDSDGFLDASPSYNRIDLRDLEHTAFMYHKNGGGDTDRASDYNGDGVVDDTDIAIIAEYYGLRGDDIH